MITVTLTFANLGAAIRALRDIPEDALLESTSPKSEAPTEAPVRKARKSSATLTVVEPADAPAPTTASPEEVPAPVAAAEPAAPDPIAEAPAPATINYADLQKAVLKLYSKDRALATSVAVGLGYDNFKVMPSELWSDALAAVNEKLAELED